MGSQQNVRKLTSAAAISVHSIHLWLNSGRDGSRVISSERERGKTGGCVWVGEVSGRKTILLHPKRGVSGQV